VLRGIFLIHNLRYWQVAWRKGHSTPPGARRIKGKNRTPFLRGCYCSKLLFDFIFPFTFHIWHLDYGSSGTVNFCLFWSMYRHQTTPIALRIGSRRGGGVFGITSQGWITNQAREKEQRSSVIPRSITCFDKGSRVVENQERTHRVRCRVRVSFFENRSILSEVSLVRGVFFVRSTRKQGINT